jgi:hypothetical protein
MHPFKIFQNFHNIISQIWKTRLFTDHNTFETQSLAIFFVQNQSHRCGQNAPFQNLPKLSQHNFTNLKDTFVHKSQHFWNEQENATWQSLFFSLGFFMECNFIFSVHLCVQKSNKKQRKFTKKPPKCAPSILLLYEQLSFFRNFQLWPFSFLLTTLHNDYKRNEDTGKMPTCNRRSSKASRSSSMDVVVFSSRCEFAKSLSTQQYRNLLAQVNMFLCMFVSLFFFFFLGCFLVNFFCVCS